MKNDLNILILSCGTRNKLVQYFKKELSDKGTVIAADCSELSPALYEADKHYIVPRIHDENYLEAILSICKENQVKGLISLIDPELNVIAANKEVFLDIGTTPIISDFEIIETCFNKYKMYEVLVRNGFKTAKSYVNKELFYKDLDDGLISFPVFVKPITGSASININKVTSKDEVDLLFDKYDNLMIQEYLDGTEYGVDVYIDMISKEPVSIFIKKKLKMRAGETDKSVSIKDAKLFDLVTKFVKSMDFTGIIDIDIFLVNGDYYISEVNPRFGGGYPHAYESGMNVPKMIINNLSGLRNQNMIGDYEEGIVMMKYNELRIKRIPNMEVKQ
jgi:carbamoyl-phosphate synthase large subunit